MSSSYHTIRGFARENRKSPTPAEKVFWKFVRGKKFNGHKFHRQYIFPYKLDDLRSGYFIADFYCAELKLIIELDGRIHNYQKEYDQYRTEILEAIGLKVVRFSNDMVLNYWEEVVVELEKMMV